MSQSHAIFLVNLLQDVNILRPLAFMAARDFGFSTEFLVTHLFTKWDVSGAWRRELEEIAETIGAAIIPYRNDMEGLRQLQGKGGLLVAGSESNLSAHAPTHNLFRIAPSSFITVTLQHGFECVGFRQSRDRELAHGCEVAFGADVVCAWCEGERLTAMAPSQRSKLHVTGPAALLQARPRAAVRGKKGLVCENLHCVRLNIAGDFKTEFVSAFNEFCAALAKEGREVVLRPHPGGQYVLKNNVTLQKNVTLNNNPIYKVDLSRYAYGISAPSSILIDMLLADIPTAIWRDGAEVMDGDNYQGLTEISSLSDWLDFSRAATAQPDRFVERQRAFLEKQKMPLDPVDVYRRYAALFSAARRRASPIPFALMAKAEADARVMFIANAYIPTLQLSFVKPLAPLVEAGDIATDFITDAQVKEALGESLHDSAVYVWLDERLNRFRPTIVVFCRYSGPRAEYVTAWAQQRNVSIVYHIDDDLLGIPPELGKAKYEFHNHPLRLATVRHLLDHADLVYCSTPRLKERMHSLGATAPLTAGKVYASGSVIGEAAERPARKIGYMGFDHASDFEIALPAVVAFLSRNPNCKFELFGSIPRPAVLDQFGDRVSVIPPVRNYETFLRAFAKRSWDIGICPLAPTPFNMVKANTKWVEYTSVGAAVVASRDTVYDECCADGCGVLAGTNEEWLTALERLAHDPAGRLAQVARARERLVREYSSECLQVQVLDVFNQARRLRERSQSEAV